MLHNPIASAVEVAILSLVAFRLFVFIGRDTITQPLRERIIFGQGWPALRKFVTEWMTCAWCIGTWITLLLSIIVCITGLMGTNIFLLWAASAAVVGVLGERTG